MIRILKYEEGCSEQIFKRTIPQNLVADKVAAIIEKVKRNGDAALLDYAEKLDGAKLSSLAVTEEEMAEALKKTEPEFLKVLERAAENIRNFHEKQLRTGFTITGPGGVLLGQRIMPIEKVGLTVPGGEAPLSSTVLMDAIPAKIAGCREIVMVTPAGPDGRVNPSILAAAKVAGVTRIFKCGGAQGIAALAYGTESIPKVDKIVGPGGAFVSEAKRQVFGRVAIDMIAGPSEILVIADDVSDAKVVAADLLSQAEHDEMASAVLVTDSQRLAREVAEEIEKQLKELPREAIARESIESNGKIIIAEDIKTAVKIADEIAPEHLELFVDNPFDYLDDIKNAGSIFMGRYCPESLGDYMAGMNHTLPTSGTARFSSPLSVDDFLKKSQFCYYTKEALEEIAPQIDKFARKEELVGHARSATIHVGK